MNSTHKGTFKLRCYTSEQIPYIWETARPHIEIALNRGSTYTIDEIHDGLLKKEMQLWMWGDEAALVSAIQTDDIKFCCLITLGGTNMRDWLKYLPIVEEWARNEGAEEIRAYGRPGWARLPGWKLDYARSSRCLADQEA